MDRRAAALFRDRLGGARVTHDAGTTSASCCSSPGFLFEGVGDEQLRRFKADRANSGKRARTPACGATRGIRIISAKRVLWWGFGLIRRRDRRSARLLGPAIITYLLIHVSGVAMLESTLIEKAGYIQYVGRTPAFLPLPAKVQMQLMAKLRGLQKKPTAPPKRRYY